MAYTPYWEPLAHALERVTATGVTEDAARTDLCRAVADGKVNVRLRVEASVPLIGGRVLLGANIRVPQHLAPGDFDWVQSRPLKPWPVGPSGPQHYSVPWWDWQNQPIELIELATGDVLSIFGSPKPLSKRAAIGHDEKMAIRTLRDLLLKNKNITSKEAFRECREKHPRLSERGFKERVWERGRELAKLTPKARAGRKPKSPRSAR